MRIHEKSLKTYLYTQYFIGFQEVNSQPQNLLVNLFKSDPWTQKFNSALKPSDCLIVKTKNLQGLLLIVFAKRKHVPHE